MFDTVDKGDGIQVGYRSYSVPHHHPYSIKRSLNHIRSSANAQSRAVGRRLPRRRAAFPCCEGSQKLRITHFSGLFFGSVPSKSACMKRAPQRETESGTQQRPVPGNIARESPRPAARARSPDASIGRAFRSEKVRDRGTSDTDRTRNASKLRPEPEPPHIERGARATESLSKILPAGECVRNRARSSASSAAGFLSRSVSGMRHGTPLALNRDESR